jgi:hypothetical protein
MPPLRRGGAPGRTGGLLAIEVAQPLPTELGRPVRRLTGGRDNSLGERDTHEVIENVHELRRSKPECIRLPAEFDRAVRDQVGRRDEPELITSDLDKEPQHLAVVAALGQVVTIVRAHSG